MWFSPEPIIIVTKKGKGEWGSGPQYLGGGLLGWVLRMSEYLI